MHKGRLEAFSDGVIAIILTIMVLELKIPHSAEVSAITEMFPIFISYILSFIFIGIYWSNHHHLLQASQQVNGAVLWANLHLLFWLSLTPFVTGWMGETHFAPWPVFLYGVDLICSAIAYTILTQVLIRLHGKNSTLARAVGKDFKGWVSLLCYSIAIGMAFVNSWVSYALYLLVALMWLVPDRRIEKVLTK